MAEAEAALARRLAWDACYNVRDLGGYPTGGGGRTRWRAVLRADNLCRLTPAGREALVAYGVRTIIDLRNPRELLIDPPPFTTTDSIDGRPAYLHLPLEDETDAEAHAMIAAAETGPAIYEVMLDRNQARIGVIIEAIAAAPDGPVLIHCHAGKDRTGLVSALLLTLAGASTRTIADDYALSDDYLQPLYAEWRANIDDPTEHERVARRWSTPVENMLAVLAGLEARHGGALAFLRAGGVSAASIERIRARLRESQTAADAGMKETG
jgi:protein tyrosine/serine phosphatase